MTTVLDKDKNIMGTNLLVAIRTFDHRRLGTLYQKFRKSGAWSLPAAKAEKGTISPFGLMTRAANTIPITGSRKIISAVTLMEMTVDRLLKTDTHDYLRWEMIIYDVRFEGAVMATVNPNDEKISGRVFLTHEEVDTKLKVTNEITTRFIKALEKEKCLR